MNLINLKLYNFSISSIISFGMGIWSPGLEIPGYLQALIILLVFLTSLYINHISPGGLFCHLFFSICSLLFVLCFITLVITAIVPPTIPCSFLSGLLSNFINLLFERPYCFILNKECWVHSIFLKEFSIDVYGYFTNLYANRQQKKATLGKDGP